MIHQALEAFTSRHIPVAHIE